MLEGSVLDLQIWSQVLNTFLAEMTQLKAAFMSSTQHHTAGF